MIDTLGLAIPVKTSNHVIQELQDLRVEYDPATKSQILKGHKRNMRVIAKNYETVVFGSLCKFRYGNNLETLSRKEIALTLGQLEDELQLPLKDAKILRYDIGTNLQMDYPAPEYFLGLGEKGRYKRRHHHNTTLAYDLKRRTLHFYDKIAEMKSKNQQIPKPLLDKKISYGMNSNGRGKSTNSGKDNFM